MDGRSPTRNIRAFRHPEETSMTLPSRRRAAAFVLSCLLAVGTAVAAEPPRYVLTDLGTLSGDWSHPSRINDRGMVTGESTRHSGPHNTGGIAFFEWRKRMIGLAPRLAGGGSSTGHDVNASGVVVGEEGVRGHSYVAFPFMWSRDGYAHIGDGQGRANAINDAGTITGTLGDTLDTGYAFTWRDGVLTDLDPAGLWGYSEGMAINAAGDIVGAVGRIWQEAGVMTYFDGVMSDLGSFGGAHAKATGVNVHREICGTIFTPIYWRPVPFVLKNGILTPIGGLPDMNAVDAAAINDGGWVVGTARPRGPDWQILRAYLWHDGEIVDLNDRIAEGGDGWVLERATSINNRGEVVGRGTRFGESAAFKLTPLK
jgi:probable HAF family extracellular repeat protein